MPHSALAGPSSNFLAIILGAMYIPREDRSHCIRCKDASCLGTMIVCAVHPVNMIAITSSKQTDLNEISELTALYKEEVDLFPQLQGLAAVQSHLAAKGHPSQRADAVIAAKTNPGQIAASTQQQSCHVPPSLSCIAERCWPQEGPLQRHPDTM